MSSSSTSLASLTARAHPAVANERVVYGGMGILLLLVIYVPLQEKIDLRLAQLTHITLPEGLVFMNVLFVAAILKWFISGPQSKGEDFWSRLLTAAFLAVGSFFVLSFITAQFFTQGTFFLYELIGWKRTASTLLIYFFTKKLVHSRRQIIVLFSVMALIVGFAGYNLMRENFSNGLSSSHFKEGLRFGGIFGWGGENDLGAFLAEFVFIPLLLFKLQKGLLKKILFLGLAVLAITGCVFTYSRGAWIGLSAGLIVYIWRHSRLSLVAVLLAVFFFATSILPASVIDRWNMTEDQQTGQLESSAQNRVDVWQQGLQVVTRYPLFGVGYDRFRSVVEMHIEPHNAYLKIAAEQGIPGLLVFLSLLGIALCNARGASDPFEREISIAYSACWVAFVFVNFFGNRTFREGLICYFWVFTGIIVWLRTRRSLAAKI